MHSRRTTPPNSKVEAASYRPPNPGDKTEELIRSMRAGDNSAVFMDEEEDEEQESLPAPPPIPGNPPAPGTPAMRIPPILTQLLGTDAEGELLAVANILNTREKRRLTMMYHTPIGDVKCPVSWCNLDPAHLGRPDQSLMLVLVRTSETLFTPRAGAELEISFDGYRSESRMSVLCLAAPMQLYPGVGIDLLCFLPQNTPVEKQGVLKDGAPSVVSGRVSDDVDKDSGEPIASGEKSAFIRVATPPEVPREDFDKARQG